MQAKTERFELRLDPDLIDRIDQWRGGQSDVPARAEAVRRLIEHGLLIGETRELRLSDGEKLIAIMLGDLAKALKTKSLNVDPDFVASAIHGGHYWALEWEYPSIFHHAHAAPAMVTEVVDILDMWDFLESAAAQMPKADREKISAAKGMFSDMKFVGFDGNNETEHLSIARFLIEKMGRFSTFRKRDLNSHWPLLPDYRRMLIAFLPMRSKLMGRGLSVAELIEILAATGRPSA